MSFAVEWNSRIPMRDGALLSASIYRPADKGVHPTIVVMTPYGVDRTHAKSRYFAEHGLNVVVVDVRGRGESDGVFEPHIHERHDSSDVIEWSANQSWCDGNVAMFGGSYLGMAQWLAAAEHPSHLRTIAPCVPSMAGIDHPAVGGSFTPFYVQWLALTGGRSPQFNAIDDQDYWLDVYRRLYLEHRPFGELANLSGNPSRIFDTWIAHQTMDAYWDQQIPSRAEFEAIAIPVLTIGGLYDDALVATVAFYTRHNAAAGGIAADHHLLLGPWDHAGAQNPRPEVGGLKFAKALLDLNALHVAWYQWVMQGRAKPSLMKHRVVYYVTGEESWRTADRIEDVTQSRKTLFLHSRNGEANDVFYSGRLDETDSASPPATYKNDPLDTRPADLIGPIDLVTPITLFDQTLALNTFGNGLIYHTDPLPEAMFLAGFIEIHLWIALDVPDADFRVSLYQILPTGESLILGETLLRARYRRSFREAEFPEPGVPIEYVFDRLAFQSRLIARYSRFRFVVSSPNTPYNQKNYNSGGDVMWETAADARVANVTVFHEPPHASYILLPVGNPNTTVIADDVLREWLQ
ncbi:MAG: CocE/NonD family hydrolase [Vulcanimicrobiaceae bacterium]